MKKKTNKTIFVVIALVAIMTILSSCNSIYNDKLTYEWSGFYNGWIVTSYNGSEKNVVIPNKLISSRDDVIGIAKNCFKDTKIESIKFPKNLKFIGDSAFENTVNLTGNLDFPNTLEYIGRKAFYMTNINHITLFGSISHIGKNAFYKENYSDLSLVINSEYNDFRDVIKNFKNWAKGFRGNYSVLTYSSNKSVIEGDIPYNIKNLVIPSFRDITPVTTIAPYALAGMLADQNGQLVKDKAGNFINKIRSYETIKFGENIETIGLGSFYLQKKLHKIEFNDKLKTIGLMAFGKAGVDSETPIEINKLPDSLETIEGYAFSEANVTGDLVLGENTKVIKEGAFTSGTMNPSEAKTKLNSVTFNKNIETIERYAFGGNPTLEKVIFPKDCNLKTLGPFVFIYSSGLKEVQLPTNLEVLDKNAFLDSSLKELNIPKGIKEISEESTQTGWMNLEKIVFDPNSNIKDLRTLYTGDRTLFYRTKDLKEVILPPSLEIFDFYSFQGSMLENITIPKNVSKLRTKNVQYDLLHLKNIVIEDNSNLVNLEISPTFEGFNGANYDLLKLGNGLITIGANVFNGSIIKSLYIPDSIISIDKDAFKNMFNSVISLPSSFNVQEWVDNGGYVAPNSTISNRT